MACSIDCLLHEGVTYEYLMPKSQYHLSVGSLCDMLALTLGTHSDGIAKVYLLDTSAKRARAIIPNTNCVECEANKPFLLAALFDLHGQVELHWMYQATVQRSIWG